MIYKNGVYIPPLDDVPVDGELEEGITSNRVFDLEAIVTAKSKVVWKDASELAMSDLNRSSNLNFTDLDLTAYTSANAKFVLLALYMVIDTVPAGAWTQMAIRKNGTTPSIFPTVYLDNTMPVGKVFQHDVICGLDSGQVTEYRIVSAGWTNGQVDSFVYVLGYIE